MRWIEVALLLAALFGADVSRAECPESDICCHAGQAAIEASDWETLHRIVQEAPQCDDGWIAETYSERVSILLTENWSLLSQLHQISASHPEFLTFVLRHMDESVPEERWARVRELATNSCPIEQRDLCAVLR